MLEIKYVKMPISIEEKKKYHREGFRVVDEKFKPADLEEDEAPARKSRRRNAAEDEE
jgi:hypothetical protein